jgi:hypothetical protein
MTCDLKIKIIKKIKKKSKLEKEKEKEKYILANNNSRLPPFWPLRMA